MLTASGDSKSARERLAKLIKELRGKATQREFAKLLGTSYTAVQDWEKGIRLPNSKNLNRIAQLKGWTQTELIQHIFDSEVNPEHEVDLVERVIANLQTLSPAQIQTLRDYLLLSMNKR